MDNTTTTETDIQNLENFLGGWDHGMEQPADILDSSLEDFL
jgi:hypothetical protein